MLWGISTASASAAETLESLKSVSLSPIYRPTCDLPLSKGVLSTEDGSIWQGGEEACQHVRALVFVQRPTAGEGAVREVTSPVAKRNLTSSCAAKGAVVSSFPEVDIQRGIDNRIGSAHLNVFFAVGIGQRVVASLKGDGFQSPARQRHARHLHSRAQHEGSLRGELQPMS